MKKQGYNHKKPCKDHLGKRYSSLSEMCKAYDIKVDTFQRRINVYEWTVEEALTREAHPGKLLEEQSVEDWICV